MAIMEIRTAKADRRKKLLEVEDDIKVNATVQQILKATPVQIDTFIDTNVTDLASAKEFLKKLTRLVIYLERRR